MPEGLTRKASMVGAGWGRRERRYAALPPLTPLEETLLKLKESNHTNPDTSAAITWDNLKGVNHTKHSALTRANVRWAGHNLYTWETVRRLGQLDAPPLPERPSMIRPPLPPWLCRKASTVGIPTCKLTLPP